MRLSAASGGDAADHAGSGVERQARVEGALGSGHALADDAGGGVDEDGHQADSRGCGERVLDGASGGVIKIVGGVDGEVGVGEDGAALGGGGSGEADDERNRESDVAGGGDDAVGDDVATEDAAKDVDKDDADSGVVEDDAEGFGDALAGCAAADVEEVCGLGAELGDDIERRHGEPGAVNHAANRAIQADIAEVVFAGASLHGVFLVGVAEFGEVFLAEEGVVVDGDFGVHGDEGAVGSQGEGVDFEEGEVALDDGAVERGSEAHHGAQSVAREVEGVGDAGAMPRATADEGVDGEGEDAFGGVGGDGFDVDAAVLGGDEGDAPDGAVDQQSKIQFAFGLFGALDIDLADEASGGTGLRRHEGHAEDGAGGVARGVGRVDKLDAAAFAASSGVDLRLDDPPVAAEALGDASGVVGVSGGLAAEDGRAKRRDKRLGLMFVEVHAESPSRRRRQAPTSSRTAATEASNMARSASVREISTTRSTPPSPRMTGTPT